LGDQRRDGEGYALRDGDWRGRIEALAVFSAEAHGTYADPSTPFVHGLSCHLPLPHNAGSQALPPTFCPRGARLWSRTGAPYRLVSDRRDANCS